MKEYVYTLNITRELEPTEDEIDEIIDKINDITNPYLITIDKKYSFDWDTNKLEE